MENSFLGTGWSFPPEFDQTTGSVRLTSGESDIEASLEVLLSTRLGERVMRHDFGCNLDALMFEPLTSSLQSYMAEVVKQAILFYEPRIEMESLRINGSSTIEGLYLLTIDYRVRTTNSRLNYVFPFYREEATEVRNASPT